MQTPERRVKVWISEWLKKHGVFYFMPVQTGYGPSGLDYFCCWHGWFVAIEAKAGTEVTGRQATIMKRVIEAGGHAYMVGSETDPDVSREVVNRRMDDIDAHVRLTTQAAHL